MAHITSRIYYIGSALTAIMLSPLCKTRPDAMRRYIAVVAYFNQRLKKPLKLTQMATKFVVIR